jgi:hypothetical protein
VELIGVQPVVPLEKSPFVTNSGPKVWFVGPAGKLMLGVAKLSFTPSKNR